MGKYVHRVIPFESCEISSIESWLEDMEKKGLRLAEGGGRFAKFLRAEPGNARYGAEYVDVSGGVPAEETRELYSSLGWEYVDSMAGDLFIYRAEDSAAPPLHNDYAGLEKPMRHMRQKQLALGWVFLLMGVFQSVGSAAMGLLTGRGLDYWALLEYGTGRTVFSVLLTVLLLAIAVIHFRRAALAKGIIIRGELPPPTAGSRRRCVAAGLLLPLSLVCALSWFALKLDRPGVHRGLEVEEGQVFPFPLLCEVSPEAGLALAAAAASGDHHTFSNTYYTERDILSPEIVSLWQELEGDSHLRYRVEYYRTRSPWIAEELGRDLLAVSTGYGSWTDEELEVPGADSASYHREAGGTALLLLRSGERVECVSCVGELDLRKAIPIFMEYLAR